MAYDFFNHSPSYLNQIRKRPDTLESRRIIIAEASEDDYIIPEERIPFLIEVLKKKGLPCSRGKILDTCMIYRRTKKALLGNKKEQDFLKNLDTNRHWIAVPYECFLADKLEYWKKVSKLIPSVEELDSKQAEEIPILTNEATSLANEVSSSIEIVRSYEVDEEDLVNQQVAEIRNLMDNSCEKLIELIMRIQASHNLTKRKLADCFDRLRELSASGSIINDLKENIFKKEGLFEELRKERDFFRDEISKLELEVARLGDDNGILKMEIEESQIKFIIAQDEIVLLQKRIADLNKHSVLAEKILALVQEENSLQSQLSDVVIPSYEKPPESTILIQKNNLPELPVLYMPTKASVQFEKPFMSFFKYLCNKDRKNSKSIFMAIKNICNNGLEGTSYERKTMDEPSNTGHSPANCIQVSIKKLRFTMKIQGDLVTYYELYYRKESVFGSRNRN